MVREVVEQSAKDTVAELKQTSPSPEHHMYSPKRKYKDGDYAKSWTYDKNQIKSGRWIHSTVVYNKKHYRLTHLLENGHDLIRNGKRYGYYKGNPHIKPARDVAEEKLFENMVSKLAEVGFE